jgi:1-acyl-sn-glycerol-3-phosphate acyltransferase
MFYLTQKNNNMNLFIRSLFIFLFSCVTIPIYSFFCLASLLLFVPLRYRCALVRSYLHIHIFLLKKICRIDYQIEGLGNIPKNRPVIILSKHQSTWETFFLPLIFHAPAIILKRELLWIPFFGWGLAVTDPIAIDRGKQKSAMQQIINKGKQCLQKGRSILVFPEGTRIPFGQVGKYKLGGARLAVETHTPILPVAHNAGRFWPKGKFIKTPGTIRIVIGPLIETEGQKTEVVLEQVKSWIENTVTLLSDQ